MEKQMQTLEQMEGDVLRKLALLAEGRAGAYDKPNLHRAHPQSCAPFGFSENRALSPWLSLKEYHAALMANARERGLSARLMAIAQAFADHEFSVKRMPSYNSNDSAQNTEDRDAAILNHFEGLRPEWPAAYMGCSASHVEKLRRKDKRDATLGAKLEDEAIAA